MQRNVIRRANANPHAPNPTAAAPANCGQACLAAFSARGDAAVEEACEVSGVFRGGDPDQRQARKRCLRIKCLSGARGYPWAVAALIIGCPGSSSGRYWLGAAQAGSPAIATLRTGNGAVIGRCARLSFSYTKLQGSLPRRQPTSSRPGETGWQYKASFPLTLWD